MWLKQGNSFNFRTSGQDVDYLPKGIYVLEYGPFGRMYLDFKQENFEFSYKLYGQDGFPERVIKKFQHSKSNLGVMLCGLKGTGKTVQAEQICNYSGLPVILVTKDFEGGKELVEFLSYVDQEVVVMIDEYEKIFGKKEGLLTIMDGVLNAKHKRLFILTANNSHIADALIDRPGRIHYFKKFGNLSVEVLKEIVEDMLVYKKFRNDVMEYFSAIEIITIDIVKTIISEVNLFNEPPLKFKNFLNVSMAPGPRWDVYNEKGEFVLKYVTSQLINPFSKNTYLEFNVEYGEKTKSFGCIESCNAKTGIIVTDEGTYLLKRSTLAGYSTVHAI